MINIKTKVITSFIVFFLSLFCLVSLSGCSCSSKEDLKYNVNYVNYSAIARSKVEDKVLAEFSSYGDEAPNLYYIFDLTPTDKNTDYFYFKVDVIYYNKPITPKSYLFVVKVIREVGSVAEYEIEYNLIY